MIESAQLDLQLMDHFNERHKRLYAATLSRKYGYGGVTRVHKELGLDFKTIRKGIKDLSAPPLLDRVRKAGGGRKKKLINIQKYQRCLLALLNPEVIQ